uniref:Uncharacterized protein n=1 Tax=Panagrolaimus sp. ES5 TaxID=591445 RepID=A0AC34G698_9BILA
MTPTLRSKVLNVLNVARNKLESGQLLLNNGKYALQAATLPDLEWSCEMEEEIFEYMEDICPSFPNFNLMTSNLTWVYSRYDETNVETFVDAMLQENEMFLTGTHYTQFARHNLMVHVYPVNHIIAFSDKAQYVACAIQNCDIHTFNDGSMPWIQGDILNNIYCKISLTEELEFKDEIYQVSPSANYIPPTQDVVCKNTERTVDQREAVLEKINAARSEISLGTYSLPNGEPVVSPAQPLSPLVTYI